MYSVVSVSNIGIHILFFSVVGVGARGDVRQEVDPAYVVSVGVLLAGGEGIG